MTKARVVLLCAFVALTLGTVPAATASAHEWVVNGTPVGATPFDGTSSSGSSAFTATILGVKVLLLSKKSAGSFLIEKEGKGKGTISFTEIAVGEISESGTISALPRCTVPSISAKFKSNIVEFNGKLAEEYAEAGSPFASFAIQGLECPIKKALSQITGTATAVVPEGEVLKVTHIFEFHPTGSGFEGSQHLKLGGEEATMLTNQFVVLNNDLKDN
jgi:hypothetical protein